MFENYSNVLALRAQELGDKTAYSFQNGTGGEIKISYKNLLINAKALAVTLLKRAEPGDRVLLLYAPSNDYIVAFWACLLAGLIPVPAYLPTKRNTNKITSIATNAQIKVALCADVNAWSQIIKRNLVEINEANLLHAGDIDLELCNEWTAPLSKEDDVAFLQYTSGSTSAPKGVMVTHKNLLANSQTIKESFNIDESFHLVSWLPPFHDMGLIGVILQVVYSGTTSTLMSPVTFVKKPHRWLKAISEATGPVATGAPNFAFDLCVDKIKETDLPNNLDLAKWQCCISGAEPIRSETLKRFYNRFKKYNFKEERFFPTYGLAEATLLVSAPKIEDRPLINTIDSDKLANENKATYSYESDKERVSHHVGCGGIVKGHKAVIVDSKTKLPCPDSHVGEVWLQGPSIAKGYWNNDEESQKIFNLYLANGDGPFMNTGDLGYFDQGQLFITGRTKDLIIINGKNHYPQDIELSVFHAHNAIRNEYGAAFSIMHESQEVLVIVQELERSAIAKANYDEIFDSIINGISSAHLVAVHQIILTSVGAITRTSSGKIQRQKMRQLYLANEIDYLCKWEDKPVTSVYQSV